MEMDEYKIVRTHKRAQAHAQAHRKRMFEVQHRKCDALWLERRKKNFKFDVLFSGTILLLVGCCCSAVFLFKRYYVSWISTSCFPISSFDREPGNFTPFMNYNLCSLYLALSSSFRLFLSYTLYEYVSGALKFVVNGFLMQILYSIWPIVNNTHFHIRIFMFVWGMLLLLLLLLLKLLLPFCLLLR